MAKRPRRAAKKWPPPAIGSFVAGTIATVLVTLFCARGGGLCRQTGPAGILHADAAGLHHGERRAGSKHGARAYCLVRRLAARSGGYGTRSPARPLTGGVPELLDGIEIVLVAVGLFAMGPRRCMRCCLRQGGRIRKQDEPVSMTASDWRRSIPAWLRGTAIGAPFGLYSAAAPRYRPFLSYAGREETGQRQQSGRVCTKGAIEGVAGPEAANNATVTAGPDPLLTLASRCPTHGHSAGRVPELRHPARTTAVHQFVALVVGLDRLAVHRQRDAAGAEICR